MSLGKKLKHAAKKVLKVGKKAAAYGLVVPTGGASLMLLAGSQKAPSVDTDGAEDIIDRSEENAKKARAKLLATSGGILGAQVEDVEKSSRTLFGN